MRARVMWRAVDPTGRTPHAFGDSWHRAARVNIIGEIAGLDGAGSKRSTAHTSRRRIVYYPALAEDHVNDY